MKLISNEDSALYTDRSNVVQNGWAISGRVIVAAMSLIARGLHDGDEAKWQNLGALVAAMLPLVARGLRHSDGIKCQFFKLLIAAIVVFKGVAHVMLGMAAY